MWIWGGGVAPICSIRGCATWQVWFGEKLPYTRVHFWSFALHSWKWYYALCILILLAHNIYSMEHVWRIHQSVYITQTLGHMRIHCISLITSTLHKLHGGCVTSASRIHCIYFIEHMWHIPTDVYTTHKSLFMWIHYIYTMVYTQHMHHGGCVMHTWSCICRAILRS